MDTIEADFLSGMRSFETPKDAIEFGKSFDLQNQKSGIEACTGRTIIAVQWGDGALELNLDNSKIIHFGIMSEVVEYSILDTKLVGMQLPSRKMSDIISLKLRDYNFIWNRREVLSKIEGKKLQRIFATPDRLYVYIQHFGIFSVCGLVDIQENKPFLFWCPSD